MNNINYPRPVPAGANRKLKTKQLRDTATQISINRANSVTATNGEENEHTPFWPMQFSKGLPHDNFGDVDPKAYALFVDAINSAPDGNLIQFEVPLGPNAHGLIPGAYWPHSYAPETGYVIPNSFACKITSDGSSPSVRNWESPRAGHVHDLQGADADDFALDAAPKLGSDELTAEVAEVYGLALLRDVSFDDISSSSATTGPAGVSPKQVLDGLKQLNWFQATGAMKSSNSSMLTGYGELSATEYRRREARLDSNGKLTAQSVFRGSTNGAKVGPYISQFMLVGTGDNPEFGEIGYGAQTISQQISSFDPERDYMFDWYSWLDVQNGANVRGLQKTTRKTFIRTPRDLASYVRVDQLYQAYLNAALILLENGASFELGLPTGKSKFLDNSGFPTNAGAPTRDSFATFGGPHLLSLLTEVASRGLKGVRRQKFNFHRRCRPEQIGSLLTKIGNGQLGRLPAKITDPLAQMYRDLANTGLTQAVKQHNAVQLRNIANYPLTNLGNPESMPDSLLLPMAYIEGSPMHPAYGAGHATVAGACVTIIKAFFQMF